MAVEFNFDLKQIRSFVEVAAEKSFTRASRKLKMGQATVSHHISGLEDVLGVRLISRTSKSFALTQEGEIFRRFCEKILGEIDDLRGELENTEPLGTMHIGASTVPATYILPRAIARIRQANPRLMYTVETHDSRGAIETVREGRLEMAITGKSIRHPQLEFIHIGLDEIILVGPPDSPSTVGVKDITSVALVGREKGSGTRGSLEEALKEYDIRPSDLNVIYECSTTEGIKEAVIAGIGMAFISAIAVSRELASGSMKRIRIPSCDIRRDFYVVKQKNRPLSHPAQVLLDEILNNK